MLKLSSKFNKSIGPIALSHNCASLYSLFMDSHATILN